MVPNPKVIGTWYKQIVDKLQLWHNLLFEWLYFHDEARPGAGRPGTPRADEGCLLLAIDVEEDNWGPGFVRQGLDPVPRDRHMWQLYVPRSP
jgi:hypothetical protein